MIKPFLISFFCVGTTILSYLRFRFRNNTRARNLIENILLISLMVFNAILIKFYIADFGYVDTSGDSVSADTKSPIIKIYNVTKSE